MDAVNDGVVVGESESEGGDGAATVTVIVPSSLSSDVVFPTVLSLSSSLSSSSSSEVAADATVVASTMVSPPPPPPPPHPITPFPRQQNFSESSSISEVEVAASVAENDIGASQNKQNNRTEPDHATTSLDALDSSSPSVTKNITTPAYLRDAGSIQAAEDANMRTNDDSDSELPPFAASFKPHPNSKPLAFVAHSQPPATSASHTTSSSVHTFSGSDAEDESESRRIPSTTAAVKKKKRHHSSSSGSSGIYIATTESTSHSHPFPSTSKPTPIVSTSISAKTPKLPSTSTSKRPSPKSESAETLATAAVRPKEPRFRTITDERDIESIFRSVPIPDSDSNDGDFVLEGFVSSSGVKGSGKRRTSSGSFFEKGNAEKGSLSEKGVSSAKRKEGLLSGYVAVDGKGGEKQSSSNVRDSVKTSSESLKESAKESKAKEAKDRPKSALATLAVKKEASASTSSKMDAPKQEIGQEFIRKQAEAHRKLEQETLSSPRTAPPAKSKPTALKPTKPKRDEEDEIGASSGAEGGSSGGEGGGTVRVEVNLRAKKEPTAPKRKAGRPPSGGGGPKAPNRTDVIMIANKAIPLSAINNTDRSGRTPLFRVSGNGDTSAVTALIRAGADVNAKDNAGWSPLHEACLEGQLETATLLIRYGADVNAQGFDHVTPLHDAVESNHYEVVELLLSHGASLAAQTRQGHTPSDGVEDETMAQILQLWRRMTAKVLEVDAEGLTLLHTYAMRGDIKQVRRVLKYGAEVDFACHAGWTPLHEAAGKGFVEVVEELCRYGAVVDARNLDLGTGAAFEITPLMDAAAAGHAGVARMLLEFGADLEAKDSEGRTALDYAEGEDVKELLKRPAETWKPPLRTPDFIKSKPGNVGMMARIRDQASERLARSEATGNKDPRFKINKKNSVSSDTSHSTNIAGSLTSKGIPVTASTAATVGLGGPTQFSWGGLDPKEREGPFASSREERKFNALLKTLGDGGASGSPVAQAPVRTKGGPKPRKEEGKKKKAREEGDSDDERRREGKEAKRRKERDSDDSDGGGKSKKVKKSVSDEDNSASDEDESMEQGRGEQDVRGLKRPRKEDDVEDAREQNQKKKKAVAVVIPSSASASSTQKFTKVPAAPDMKTDLSSKSATNNKLASMFEEDIGRKESIKVTVIRKEKEREKDRERDLDKDREKERDKPSVKSAAKLETHPSLVAAQRKPIPSSNLSAPHPLASTLVGSMPNTAMSTSAATSGAINSFASPFRKKPKKKNLFGISGYQRAGDDPPPLSKGDDAESSSSANTSAIDLFKPNDAVQIIEPSVSSEEQARIKADASRKRLRCLPLYKIPLAPLPPSCAVLALPKKAFKLAVAAALPPKPYFVDLQVAQYLGKKSGREVLELFPSLSRRVATLAQKEQLSASPVGEAVLSALMECQRRDARLNETDTDGDEAVVRLPPRWIQWYERDGKRAMKLDDVDIQFLDAEEVLKEIQGLCASSKANKAAGARLEGLFDEDDSSVAAAVASRQQDEEDDEIEVEELELSKFAGVSVENRVVLDIAAAMGGRTDTKGLSAAAAEQQAASKGMAFHKFRKFRAVPRK